MLIDHINRIECGLTIGLGLMAVLYAFGQGWREGGVGEIGVGVGGMGSLYYLYIFYAWNIVYVENIVFGNILY